MAPLSLEPPGSEPIPNQLEPGELSMLPSTPTPSNNIFSWVQTAPSSQYSDNFLNSTPFQGHLLNAAQAEAEYQSPPQGAQLPQFTPQGAQLPQHAPQGTRTEKRGANSPLLPNRTNGKTVRINPPPAIPYSFQSTFQSSSDSSEKLVLQARDLLVRAYSATQSQEKQTKLLDLFKVFREYTEHGRIRNTSSILATQVANLERATKKIETTKLTSYAQAVQSTNQAS